MRDFLSIGSDLEKTWRAPGPSSGFVPRALYSGCRVRHLRALFLRPVHLKSSLSAPVLAGRVISVFTVILHHHAPTLC